MKDVNIDTGLSLNEVQERYRRGLVNYNDEPKTKTVKQIVKDNVFTYFNYLNLALGILVFIAGWIKGNVLFGLKNCLFMGVIIVNSIISIIEEIISKKIIDKLSIVNESRVNVLRDGKYHELSLEQIVIDDIIKLSQGHQIVADSIILEGEIEVNECLITGESDSIKKTVGDELLSGSFIVSGNAKARVIHVGKENYVSKITNEAKYKKQVNSMVMGSFTKMLKILSIAIVPSGIIMLISQYSVTKSFSESIFTTVASLIGMIPDGLILLTSSVMAVGVIKLYRANVLVQELTSIEILARVDTICLDKTGTLTEGRMEVKKIINSKEYDKDKCEEYLKDYTLASEDTNQTMLALKEYFPGGKVECNNRINFSSARKFSAIEFDGYTLYLGAPDVLLKDNVDKRIDDYVEDYRVIVLCYKKGKIDETLANLESVGYVLIEDIVRPSAKKTLDFFKNNNVDVKIISGDNIKTVMAIARKVGLKDIKGIEIGSMSDEQLEKVIDDYDIFARAKPEQKKVIVRYLKSKGHTVAMTGDGVNDVLALKESDCAISVKSGSAAARNISQLILLDDDFNSIPNVVKEGRQTINNVERSASLLTVKTLYTVLLIIYSVVSAQKYFFIPIQLTFITSITISIPSFLLALESNNKLVKGNFLLKIFSRSLPVSLTVLFIIVLVSLFSGIMNLSYETQSSVSVMLTAIIGLYYLFKICHPLNVFRGILFFFMLGVFFTLALAFPGFFNLEPLNSVSILLIFVLTLDSFFVYKLVNYFITFIFNKFDDSIKVESEIYKVG